MKSPKISLVIERDMLADLRRMAEEKGITLSEVVREALVDYYCKIINIK